MEVVVFMLFRVVVCFCWECHPRGELSPSNLLSDPNRFIYRSVPPNFRPFTRPYPNADPLVPNTNSLYSCTNTLVRPTRVLTTAGRSALFFLSKPRCSLNLLVTASTSQPLFLLCLANLVLCFYHKHPAQLYDNNPHNSNTRASLSNPPPSLTPPTHDRFNNPHNHNIVLTHFHFIHMLHRSKITSQVTK